MRAIGPRAPSPLAATRPYNLLSGLSALSCPGVSCLVFEPMQLVRHCCSHQEELISIWDASAGEVNLGAPHSLVGTPDTPDSARP